MSTVLTIVLNWRTAEMSLKATEAAVAAMEGVDGAITIVDNDSQDGSEEALRAGVAERGWDRVRVIQSGHNGGFGAGNNVGIRAGLPDGSKPDYIYILNSDAFPEPEAIRILRDHLDASPETGFAGSYVFVPRLGPDTSCFRFPTIASEFEGAAQTGPITRLLKKYVVPLGIPDVDVKRVDWVVGASMMMRRTVLDRIGIFDEGFFLYFEETDLCRRAAKIGAFTDYVRASKITHIGSVSTGLGRWTRTPGFWLDSRWRYFVKNHGRAYALGATVAQVAGQSIWSFRRLISRLDETDSMPRRFAQDLIAHTARNLFRPLPPDPAAETQAAAPAAPLTAARSGT